MSVETPSIAVWREVDVALSFLIILKISSLLLMQAFRKAFFFSNFQSAFYSFVSENGRHFWSFSLFCAALHWSVFPQKSILNARTWIYPCMVALHHATRLSAFSLHFQLSFSYKVSNDLPMPFFQEYEVVESGLSGHHKVTITVSKKLFPKPL